MDRASEFPNRTDIRRSAQEASLGTAVLVAAFVVWVASVVRVVGSFVHHESFGAEPTLAFVMALLMTRVLAAPLVARIAHSRRR